MNSNKNNSSKNVRPSKRNNSRKQNRNNGVSSQKIVSLPSTVSRQMRVGNATNPRFKKREYICNVGANATDARGRKLFKNLKSLNPTNGLITSVAELAVNAGLGICFPWLSKVADAFERFVFHTLKFEYVPSTGTTSKGSVALCPLYNAEDTSHPNNKVDYLNRAGTVRTPTWAAATCSLDPRKLNSSYKSHYTRKKDIGFGQDKKTYDPCELHIITETPTEDADSDVGELYVEYDVELQNSKGNTSDDDYFFCRPQCGADMYVVQYPLGDATLCTYAVVGRTVTFTINRIGNYRVRLYHKGDTYESLTYTKNDATLSYNYTCANASLAWVKCYYVTIVAEPDGGQSFFQFVLSSPGAVQASLLKVEEVHDNEAFLLEQEYFSSADTRTQKQNPTQKLGMEDARGPTLAPVY